MTGRSERQPTLPTADEVAAIPRRARIAYAGRQIRRALALVFGRFDEASIGEPMGVLYPAVKLVEMLGGGAAEDSSIGPVLDEVSIVCAAAQDAAADPLTGEPVQAMAQVAAASECIVYALRAAQASDSGQSAIAACNAVLSARLVAGTRADGTENLDAFQCLAEMARADFDKLSAASEARGWVPSTCVPAEWFGPLSKDRPAECGLDQGSGGANRGE